jgi:uncharacterized lipoprotein YehR (DUF1307 family)
MCLTALGIVALVVTTTGCGALRIHSEVRDKQGTEAKEAWAKVNTAAVIAAERDNLNKLLAAELDTQDELAGSIRDHRLRAILADTTIDRIFTDVDAQFKVLVGITGTPTVKIETIQNYETERKKWLEGIAEAKLVWVDSRTGISAPTCEEIATLSEVKNKARLEELSKATVNIATDNEISRSRKFSASAALDQLKVMCAKDPKDINVYEGIGGALGEAVDRRRTDRALATKSEGSATSLASTYRSAAKEYADATATKDGDTAVKVTLALAKLKNAAEALEKAPDAISRQFIANEKIESLKEFVAAVSQANEKGELPADAKKATVAFVLFPKLIDDAKKSLADAKVPLALPLLIQRNHEQLKLEAATREVAARQAMLRLSDSVVDTIFDEAQQLLSAKKHLEKVSGTVKGKTPLEAFKIQNEDQRITMYRGTALYLDALNRLEARRYKLEYQYIAAQHELQLAYAEVSAKQWAALIGASVEQVAAAGASGIKADRVLALLNSFGVFYIGYGVNK